jgi:hypothetical protein
LGELRSDLFGRGRGSVLAPELFWNKDTKTTDQRAWVAPIEVGGEPKANEPFRAVVRYKNTGKTIAKHVRIAFCAYGIPKGAKPDFNIVEKEPLSNEGADFPMMPDSAQNTYHTHNNGTPLTQHDVEQVESGEIVIFAFGKISYHDASDCPHWTKFCVFYDPAVKMYSIYPEYNETDQNICR